MDYLYEDKKSKNRCKAFRIYFFSSTFNFADAVFLPFMVLFAFHFGYDFLGFLLLSFINVGRAIGCLLRDKLLLAHGCRITYIFGGLLILQFYLCLFLLMEKPGRAYFKFAFDNPWCVSCFSATLMGIGRANFNIGIS